MAPAKFDIEVVHKTKVYKTVSEQIQRMIRDGLMKAGDWLPPERELAEMFNVSRTSLRDAIRNLEQLGLVEPRHGEGTVVRDPSAESLINPLTVLISNQRDLLSDLLEFRRMIEPTLAARAAARASPEEIAEMAEILVRQEQKVDRGELAIEEDSQFHYAIARAARNGVVLKVLDVFMDLLRESRERSLQVAGRLQKSLVGHHRILNSIRRHDAEGAEGAMRQHLKDVEGIILKKK